MSNILMKLCRTVEYTQKSVQKCQLALRRTPNLIIIKVSFYVLTYHYKKILDRILYQLMRMIFDNYKST
jgi:hypothetical protein